MRKNAKNHLTFKGVKGTCLILRELDYFLLSSKAAMVLEVGPEDYVRVEYLGDRLMVEPSDSLDAGAIRIHSYNDKEKSFKFCAQRKASLIRDHLGIDGDILFEGELDEGILYFKPVS